jgi:hypothetical protein
MFASRITDTVEIGDVVVTIQKLSWKSLRKAEEAKSDAALGHLAKMGNAAGAIQERADARHKDRELDDTAKREMRYAAYDRDVVLRAGIKSWTADEKLPGAIDFLEEAAANKIFRAIVDLSLPPLDAAVEETARKNA